MGLLGIAARVLLAFTTLHVLLRLSGSRTLRHGGPIDFIVALVIGDLVDDAIWQEVGMAEFAVAAAAVLATHVLAVWWRWESGRPQGVSPAG